MSAKSKQPAAEPDSFIDLWPHINQLETLLEVMDDDLCALHNLPKALRPAINRLHNLLGAAQAIGDVLAEKCRVR